MDSREIAGQFHHRPANGGLIGVVGLVGGGPVPGQCTYSAGTPVLAHDCWLQPLPLHYGAPSLHLHKRG